MLVNSDTKLCISLTSKPGRFGATVHNAGYRALGLNYIYKPCTTNNLEYAIHGIRSLGIRGCSISMPFKEEVIHYLDAISEEAKIVGAINTIVNDSGKLKGYNTDVNGVYKALSEIQEVSTQQFIFTKELKKKQNEPQEILILGGGGAARAIIHAFQKLNQNLITLKVRNLTKYAKLANDFAINLSSWDDPISPEITCLINATPIGMNFNDLININLANFPKLQLVLDMVVARNTQLIQDAKSKNIQTINGWQIALYQAFSQFKLYTGIDAPEEIMYKAALELC